MDKLCSAMFELSRSLKSLDEGYSSQNYVKKFHRALHPKWRAKVTTIEDSKDLTSLSLDELIGNLKVHDTSEECYAWRLETSSSSSSEEVDSCGDPNHLIGECPKPLKYKNQRAFIGGSWSDSNEEDDEKAKDETCLVAQASNETSPMVDDDLDEVKAIRVTKKKNLENDIED
ncbi:hypothetical protein Tco_0468242 [Tanacetum coccineum]